ncbi:hypothetical protein IW261DRAFT_1425236 [Armillaria novae-zelandiae]|uniref:Uncharacterized protein n=1 Tax=Armillaria novae-zelandiae TaxID=153914 RepID=A0AA39NT86_9AGAR|nr:hypothetical protein IW261DRAFT_1425236 [Armillaria novae-zelandiae]
MSGLSYPAFHASNGGRVYVPTMFSHFYLSFLRGANAGTLPRVKAAAYAAVAAERAAETQRIPKGDIYGVAKRPEVGFLKTFLNPLYRDCDDDAQRGRGDFLEHEPWLDVNSIELDKFECESDVSLESVEYYTGNWVYHRDECVGIENPILSAVVDALEIWTANFFISIWILVRTMATSPPIPTTGRHFALRLLHKVAEGYGSFTVGVALQGLQSGVEPYETVPGLRDSDTQLRDRRPEASPIPRRFGSFYYPDSRLYSLGRRINGEDRWQ